MWIMPRRYLDPPHLERVDDGRCIGFDRAQLVERFPVLGLAGGGLVELAHQAEGAGFGLAGHGVG